MNNNLTDWLPMERNVIMPVSFADEKIQVKRPSLISSGSTQFFFVNSADEIIGGVSIWTVRLPGKFRLDKCSPWLEITTLPTSTEEIWTISRVDDTILIDYNGEEVARTTLSDAVCTEETGWQNYWGLRTTGIKFGNDWDTASDLYRLIQLKGKSLNTFFMVFRMVSKIETSSSV